MSGHMGPMSHQWHPHGNQVAMHGGPVAQGVSGMHGMQAPEYKDHGIGGMNSMDLPPPQVQGMQESHVDMDGDDESGLDQLIGQEMFDAVFDEDAFVSALLVEGEGSAVWS